MIEDSRTPCTACDEELSLSKGARQELKQRAEHEKARLYTCKRQATLDISICQAQLKSIVSSNVLAMDSELTPGVVQAIVPVEFLRQWRAWANRPQDKPRPGAIDNTWLICQHDRLLIDPRLPQDLGTSVAFVSLADWEILQDLSVDSIALTHKPYKAAEQVRRRTVNNLDKQRMS